MDDKLKRIKEEKEWAEKSLNDEIFKSDDKATNFFKGIIYVCNLVLEK